MSEDIGEILISPSNVDVTIEWKIHHFFSLPEKDGGYYNSPLITFGSQTWQLVIFPFGWSTRCTFGHVDLELWKYPGTSNRQEFSFSLKTLKGEKIHEKHCTKVFKGWDSFHEFYQFIPRMELSRRKFELVPNGVLTIVCTKKNMTSAETDSNYCHCKQTFDIMRLSSHQQKCMHRPIKCPDCLEVVLLQKCLNKHECRKKQPEAEKDPGHACVDACTQTVEDEFSFNNPAEDYGFVTDISNLLKENRGVDVTFELETPSGGTKLFAHQLILAVMSSYFADEFYDEGRNKGYQVIPLKGIDPKAFEQMIRYCYGEKPSLITTEEAGVLFKIASKFKVMSLQDLCHTFFRHTKIDPGNVFSILKISLEMEDKRLEDMCYKILQEKTREVVATYDLCDITPAMVYTLLNLPKLSFNSEYELIKYLFDWAKVKSVNAREYLERLLKDMNFLALRFQEFAILCRDYQEFFNSDEIASIYQNIACTGTRQMPDWYNKDLKSRVYTGSKEKDSSKISN